jgi:hypothetical protein
MIDKSTPTTKKQAKPPSSKFNIEFKKHEKIKKEGGGEIFLYFRV